MASIFGLFFVAIVFEAYAADVHVANRLEEVDIKCNTDNIMISVASKDDFHGMIYPKGLSKNSTCLVEYDHAGSRVTYKLPLRSCNTMSHDITDGVEYFNTVVIEPHQKLITTLGKGFHVRCRYEKKAISSNGVNSHSVLDPTAAPLPTVTMKIFAGRPEAKHVANHVKIGDYLSLVISIEEKNSAYGFHVTNCLVKDGLNLAEQPLINNEGCPIDEDIFGSFEYDKNLTSAFVTFPAHKFPFVSVVYYKCNVKLCTKKHHGCDDVPPVCDETGHNVRRRRRRRQTDIEDRGSLRDLRLADEDEIHKSIEVFDGIYVNEQDESNDEEIEGNPSSRSSLARSEDFCISSRKFAIGISIAGILLMLAVILLVACIVHRRRRRKGSSTTGSSIYSGPYSNHAYSRD